MAGGEETAIDLISRERIEALNTRLTEQMSAQDRANRIALDAAKEAVAKAEMATDKRLEGVNELRSVVTDQQAKFALIEVINAKFDAIEARLRMLEGTAAAAQGRSSLFLVMASGAAGTVGALIGHFLR